MKRLWLLLICFMCVGDMGAHGAALVRGGKTVCTIVLGDEPTRSARMAACELQYHLAKVAGAKVKILQGTMPSSGTVILIGESRFASLGKPFSFQEYLVRVRGNVITLAGCDQPDHGKFDYADQRTFPRYWDRIGSLYAVYDFLELLGVRWYLPTDLGIAYEPRQDWAIADMERRRKPTLEHRHMFYKVGNYCLNFPKDLCGDTAVTPDVGALDKRETRLWFFRRRHGGRELFICHSMYTYYKRFWPSKKEWFAQGYEHESLPPQLCYSNEALRDQVVKDARDYFDGRLKDPAQVVSNIPSDYQSDVFPVSPMDNSARCKCSSCQKYPHVATRGIGMFANDANSDYLFHFVNEVARRVKESHPDKWIGIGSYWTHAYPPRSFRLEDNIMMQICLNSRHVFNKRIMAHQEAIFRQWQQEYPKMRKYVWMYWCFPCLQGKLGNFRVFPGFFASKVGPLFRKYRQLGMTGMYFEPSYLYNGKQGILFDQVEGSINWSLAWDETRDPQKLFEEFFRLYYGPAEKPMRAWYELAEKIYTSPADYKYQTAAIAWGQLGTAARMQKLGVFMAQAKQLSTVEPYRSRVRLFEKGIWEYMVKGKECYEAILAQGRSSMQQCSVSFVENSDPGNPLRLDWSKASFLYLYGSMRGDPVKWGLDVRMAHDGKWLYIRAVESNVEPARLKTNGEVWANDEWEFFFGERRANPYHQLLVDAAGCHQGVHKEGTSTESWTFPGKVKVRQGQRHWEVLVSVPLESLGTHGFKTGELFYGNIIRSSGAVSKMLGVWVPTFAGYHAPERFGEFYLEPPPRQKK